MITTTNLIKDFGDLRAVDDVSFDIQQGECVGLLGLNGAGKTTLLRIIACLLTPTGGRMTVDGADVDTAPELIRRRIGYLPEEPPLYGEMTVQRFLTFVARLRQVPSDQVAYRVSEAARQCQLQGVLHQSIETLSYGYRKRVGIAQAIVHRPPLVILDEPIAGLDPAQIVEMRDMVRGLSGEHTVVLSSHILTEISQTCDRILVMHRGRIVASGTEDELSAGLRGEFRLAVQVRGEREAVRKALEGVEGISSFKVTGEKDDVIVLEVRTGEDIRAELSRALVQGDLGLLELSRQADKLESIFLNLTGTEETES
jgi:ABC-2 type transport system ATP-binding protein